nr:oligomeric Golgi complex subunit 1 [Hymenolepis microstoma]
MTEHTVTEIFERQSVDEIRRMCVGIRNDVESKKMELRFLVGERHRDVIEASDNILIMKDFSHSITAKLSELQSCCVYNPANLLKGQSLRQHTRNPKKSIASQLKLLLDLPEMIWSGLDSMDYTGAVELFLLGCHLSVKMQLTGETMAAHVNARVLVKRQWAALDHVESTIASACRKQLTLHTVSDETLAQALTALLVLEDLTMRTALEEFLSGRSTALSCILGVDEETSSGQSLSSSKITVEERLSLVVNLLTQVDRAVTTLFLPNGQISCLLQKMVKWCPRETTWFGGENLFEHLPDNVAKFHITMSPAHARQPKSPSFFHSPLQPSEEILGASPSGIRAAALENDVLLEHFKTWWQSTQSFCQKHLSSVLSLHLLDLGDLVETRRALLNKLSACTSFGSVIGHRVDLWTDLFRAPFLKHLEVLLKSTLDNVFTEFETSLLSLAKSIDESGSTSLQTVSVTDDERDLASFVWSQNLLSSNETTLPPNQVESSGQISDIPLDQLLDVPPKDLVFVYFACLIGRRDLLPSTCLSMSNDPRTAMKNDKKYELSQHQLPGPLRWRLDRLLESAAFTYSAFDSRSGTQQDVGGDGETTVSSNRQELNRKKKLVTPRLKEICSNCNNRVCEIVATAASEDVATWKVLLSSIEDLITRFTNLAQRVSDEEKSNTTAHGIFCVARACFCLLDVYPALGATVVTATARILAEEETSSPFAPWTDVAKLRQAWINSSRPLRSIAARLSLSAVLRVTVESPVLDELFTTLSSIYQNSKNVGGGGDVKLVSITSQWTEIKLNPTTESDLPLAGVSLKIPSHPSFPLQEALLSLARNLTNLSVHVLPRGTLSEEFGLRLANSFLIVYSRLVQTETLSQSQAFQLLFDVRFIFRLLVSPLVSAEKNPNSTTKDSITVADVSVMGQDLLKCLEGAIDPFDLEMASERLNASIGQTVRSTASLYASLLPVHSSTISPDECSGKVDDLSNLTFLPLTPSSKVLDGKEKTDDSGVEKTKSPVFGLLPFSLSQVRPPPQVIPVVKARSQPPVQEKPKDLTTSHNSVTDFSWFSGLSFT